MNSEFLRQMKDLLQEEYPAYLEELEKQPKRGLRVNLLKTDAEHLLPKLDLSLTPSPYASNGYYVEDRPGIGRMIEAQAGLFYMQEPSASSAVTVLDPQPGMKILDLCAAPGSKSTQIAERMHHEGLLAVNEINPKRAAVLLENIERHGAANCIVLNSEPKKVADAFGPYFDAVLCDAPCSGEGMFRKSDDAVDMWSPQNVHFCAQRQAEILEEAYRALKPGGILVYSTCTLNTVENEETVAAFLLRHPDMSAEDCGVSFGRPGFPLSEDTVKCRRIFPMDSGEGHFIARMRKAAGEADAPKLRIRESRIPKAAKEFLNDMLKKPYPYVYAYKERIYGGSFPFIEIEGCRILRAQVLLGEMKKDRFEPAHHFFTSAWSDFCHTIEVDQRQCEAYLRGEQLNIESTRGWLAVCHDGAVLGGAKSDGKSLKNKYPKQLRLR